MLKQTNHETAHLTWAANATVYLKDHRCASQLIEQPASWLVHSNGNSRNAGSNSGSMTKQAYDGKAKQQEQQPWHLGRPRTDMRRVMFHQDWTTVAGIDALA